MWGENDLKVKMKLRYYKDVINTNIEDHKYLSILTNSKKKTNISKIRVNSHELPKTLSEEMICHLCRTKSIEDESHFLLKCPAR